MVSASYGGNAFSSLARDAINELGLGGAVVVAAAGNEAENNDASPGEGRPLAGCNQRWPTLRGRQGRCLSWQAPRAAQLAGRTCGHVMHGLLPRCLLHAPSPILHPTPPHHHPPHPPSTCSLSCVVRDRR